MPLSFSGASLEERDCQPTFLASEVGWARGHSTSLPGLDLTPSPRPLIHPFSFPPRMAGARAKAGCISEQGHWVS